MYSNSLTEDIDDFGIISLMYHRFEENKYPSTNIKVDDFKKHLKIIEDNKISFVNPKNFEDELINNKKQRKILLTIDDGFSSFYKNAWPILKEKKIPFILFVNTREVGSYNYMSWDQIRSMSDAGVIIANHMVEHPYMLENQSDKTSTQWLEEQKSELLEAQERIKAETGQDHKLFAYPYGEYTQTISQWVTDLGLIGFGQHSGAVGAGSDFSALPRFPLGGPYTSLSHLATRLNARPLYIDAEPRGPIDQLRDHKTWVTLNIEPDAFAMNQLRCYASQQGLMEMQAPEQAQFITIRPQAPLHAGRNKYNCTAPHQHEPGVFFWWSYLIMQPNSDGSWYSG